MHQNILKEKLDDIFFLTKNTEELLRRDNIEVRKEFPSALLWKGKELVGFNNVKEVRTYAHQKKDEITNTMDDIVVFECLYSGGAKYPITLNITKNILEYDGEEFYYPETVGSDGQYVYPEEERKKNLDTTSNSSQSYVQEKQPAKETIERMSQEEFLSTDDSIALSTYVRNLTDASLLEQYAQHNSYEIRICAFNNPYLSAKTRENMAEEFILGDWSRRAAVATNEYLPLSVLKKLLNDEHPFVLMKLAQNKNITLPLFKDLLQRLEGHTGYIKRVAKTTKFFPDTALRMFFKGDCARFLAMNINISENIMLKLANHSREDVRAILALNKNIPIYLLEKLVQENSLHIDQNAVRNPNIPLSLLKIILLRKNEGVLYNMVSRKVPLPEEIIRELSQSEYIEVRRELARRADNSKDILVSLLKDPSDVVRYNAAVHPKLPEVILRSLLNSNDEALLRGLAGNSNLPEDLFLPLANHENESVRVELAMRVESLPKNILDILLKDRSSEVRSFARLDDRGGSSDLENASVETVEDKISLAINENTSVKKLEELSYDSDYMVRGFVAKNRNTSMDVLDRLAGDTNSEVREFAQERIKDILIR